MFKPAIQRPGAKIIMTLWFALAAGAASAADITGDAAAELMQQHERFWKIATAEPATHRYSTRDLFVDALRLCATGQHMDRTTKLFELAERLQDRDPESRTFGNFFWYSNDTQVIDRNAVEFCMQAGTLIALRYYDALPDEARVVFDRLIEHAIAGCMGHRVRSSYTNIALMNATNLILLGQFRKHEPASALGRQRLDAMLTDIWLHGTHEYASPTYYGVDLTDAARLQQCADDPAMIQRASVLRRLWWTDVAANWSPAAQRLAGPTSRTYAYQRNSGELDRALAASEWFDKVTTAPRPSVTAMLLDISAPAARDKLIDPTLPREVKAAWGPMPRQTRTHWLTKWITLGSAGATYHSQDQTFTVDFAGGRNQTRAYFMPDGRGDPYGITRVAQKSGHQKALHLRPFWTAAQRRGDALGVVLYHESDFESAEAEGMFTSQFVMPANLAIFIDGERIKGFERIDLKPHQTIVLRDGPVAMGLKVVWARAFGETPAKISLISDPYIPRALAAIRLAIEHGDKWQGHTAGAALWVRISDGLADNAAFDAWQRAFVDAEAESHVEADKAKFAAHGVSVTLGDIEADKPTVALEPAPGRGVLEINGREVGRPMLQTLEPIAAIAREIDTAPTIELPPNGKVTLDVSQAMVLPPMRREGDAVVAGREDYSLSGAGRITWKLKLSKPRRVFVQGELISPNPESDSFFVQVVTAGPSPRAVVPMAAWHTGVHADWAWSLMHLDRNREPAVIDLPAGKVLFELRGRESGVKIKRITLSDKPD